MPAPPFASLTRLQRHDAWLSSTHSSLYQASAAIDNDLDTLCASAWPSTDPWLTIHIPDHSRVGFVVVYNRADDLASYLTPFSIWVGTGNTDSDPAASGSHQCGGVQEVPHTGGPFTVDCGEVVGNNVAIRLPGSKRLLSIAELEIYSLPLPPPPLPPPLPPTPSPSPSPSPTPTTPPIPQSSPMQSPPSQGLVSEVVTLTVTISQACTDIDVDAYNAAVASVLTSSPTEMDTSCSHRTAHFRRLGNRHLVEADLETRLIFRGNDRANDAAAQAVQELNIAGFSGALATATEIPSLVITPVPGAEMVVTWPSPPPPSLPQPSHVDCMPAETAFFGGCALTSAQLSRRCSCRYMWSEGCVFPVGTRVYCMSSHLGT